MKKIANYINGKLQAPLAGKYLDNVEPATGKVYSLLPDSDEQDVLAAIAAAKAAFPAWSSKSAEFRSEILLKIADLIKANLLPLAEAESVDNGKPLSLAKAMDIPRAEANMRFFATAILHEHTESYPTQHSINYTLRQAAGVAACISPWNLPLYLFTWKIAPALAAGCTVVAKPSEITPMTAFMLSELCIEAGLPAGVLNIVHGLGAKVGHPLIAHPEVPLISFTGGTVTGKSIAATAAPMFKKLSLELGGKNPTIVFADADFEETVSGTARAAFANQGQICLCGSRLFIERSIYEPFKKAFLEKVGKLVIGDPLNEGTQFGALVSESHMNKVLSYIELAKEEGGTILMGGKRTQVPGRCESGFFIEPTVIEGLDFACRTNQEEIFGPVVTLTPFDNEQEVLEWANSTQYGLAASIWTKDVKRAHRVAAEVKSGVVWVNTWLMRDLRTLFGGMKASGVGREGGFEALHFFQEAKNVCIKID